MADDLPRPFAPGEFITNPDGSWSNEQTTTVGKGEDPGLMGGQPTVIPTLWKQGDQIIHATEDQARDLAKESGLAFPTFASDQHAETFADARETNWQNIKPGSAAHLAVPPLYDNNPLRPGGAAYSIPGHGIEPPVMSEMSDARQAGHEWDAIDRYMDDRRQTSRLGGYSDGEINQYLGYKDPSLRLSAIGQEANFLTYANDVDGTATPTETLAHASGNLFKSTAGLGKPIMQDGPLPPELRAEYAQGLMGGEFTDADHFAQAYTSSIFNAAGSDGAHPLAQQATQELTDKLPNTQDLIDWSVALGGDPTLTRNSLMQHWVSTGEMPQQAYQRAQLDNDFRLDLTTPKLPTPPTVSAKLQAHLGQPTIDEQMAGLWGDSMLPGADPLGPVAQSLTASLDRSLNTPSGVKAGFTVGVQGTYDWLIANHFVRPEDGSFAPLNLINKSLALPFALLAGTAEASGNLLESYGESIGQPLLGRTLKEMVSNWGGMLGSPHITPEAMDPAMLAKLDKTARILIDTAVDNIGARPNPMRAAPIGRDSGDIMPPTSGAFNRFHDSLPAGTVLPFGEAGVRVHDDVRQFQGNIAADRTDWNATERRWAKDHPEWFKPDFLARAYNEIEQRGVDGTSLSPDVDTFWSHPEMRGARQAAFKDWSEHELRMASEEGREPADRALEPFDDNFIPRTLYNEKARADPLVPQWLEEAEPEAFGRRNLRRRSGPALRTEGRQFYVREYEDGTREVADNSRSKDKVRFNDEGRFRGKNFVVRDATIKEITDAAATRRQRLGLPAVSEGRTRLFKAERAADDAPHEGWVRQVTSAEQDAREDMVPGEDNLAIQNRQGRTGKILYMDVDPREKFVQERPLYPDPETGRRIQDPSFPRRYNLDEKLFPRNETQVSFGRSKTGIMGRVPQEVPYGEPRPIPVYRMDPIRNLRDSWLANRMKSYGAQFLIKNRNELESMGMFKRPADDLGAWQDEKPPTFTINGKTQKGAAIDLPLGFKGWVPSSLKPEFDRYIGPLHDDSAFWRIWDNVNRFIVRALFISPLPHQFNVAAHYLVGRGLWGSLGPAGGERMVRFTGEAAHQVFTNGKKYSDMQRAGSGLLFGRTIGQDIAKLHIQQMTDMVLRSPAQKAWDAAAKAIGYASGYRLIRGLYRATQKNLWFVNDTLMMSRVLELQNLRGINMAQAIREAEREIASYDLPTTIMRQQWLAEMLGNNRIVAFGRYDANRISIWKNMVTDLIGNTGQRFGTWSDLKIRAHALDQAVMMATLIVFGAPLANSVFQKISGNPAARLMMPGPLFAMDMAKRLRDGDLGSAMPFHLSGLINTGVNLWRDQNLYGKPLVNGHKSYAGIAADTVRAAASILPPVNTAFGLAIGASSLPDALVKTVFNARLPKPGSKEATAEAKQRADREAASQEAKDPLARAIRAITGGHPIDLPGRPVNPLGRAVNPLGAPSNPLSR